MIPYLLEWGSMLFRWLHIIAAMAWIGASFFFMHLDAGLKPTAEIPAGKGGADWHVHGGGFYELKKYFSPPPGMPTELVWHKWQAYMTWVSGFFLLVWIYYAQASLYLVNPTVMPLTGLQASAIGIAALVAGWFVYDWLCKSPLGKNEKWLAIITLALVVIACYGFTKVFSGRGALVHTGALIATWMAGNVFFIIMPNQRKIIASLVAGETPDPALGKEAKQRSTQNNYFTLPVVLLMLSNHYPIFYANAAVIPAIVLMVTIAGGLIRHFYNVRHANHDGKSPWWTWAVTAVLLWLTFWLAMASSPGGRERLGWDPVSTPAVAASYYPAPPAEVVEVVSSRCSMCHAREPVWDGIQIAPKDVMFDTADEIASQKQAIQMQAVIAQVMPPNNITEMTPEERRVLARWGKVDDKKEDDKK